MSNLCRKKPLIGGGVGGVGVFLFMLFSDDTGVSATEVIQNSIVELEKNDIVFEEYIKYDIEKIIDLSDQYNKIIDNQMELRSIACKDSTSHLC